VTFLALANFIADFFKLPRCFSITDIIRLLLWFGRRSFTSHRKTAGEKTLHLNMLPNNFINIHILFHRTEL
jgi:hypothetical protein